MRFLAIADTHLGYESGKTKSARQFIYESMFEVFNKVINIAKEENVDYILHGGDLFNRSHPTKKVIEKTLKMVESLLKENIGIIITPGNHEKSCLPSSLLNFFPKMHFINKFTILNLKECYLACFPFFKNVPTLTHQIFENFRTNYKDKPCIILCHQLFEKAEFGPQRFQFGANQGAINPLFFPNNIILIISGHIHRAQSLMNGFIIYPGSTERTSFIESIEPKGYLLIDLFDNKLKIRFNELESIKMNVIELDLSEKKLDFNYLKEITPKGLIRTLIRFTNKELTINEIQKLQESFPRNEYPLLTFAPQIPNQCMHPLYSNHSSLFDFQPINKKIPTFPMN